MPSVCPLHTDCVEGFAAGPAIRARIGNDILLAEAPEVAALIADYVGQALATIVLAWSPDRIVVGSGVMSTAGLIGLCAGQMHASLGGYGVGPTVTARNFVMRAALEHSGLEGALLLAQSIGERR